MTCADVEMRLDAWLDGELDATEADPVAAHVAGCAACGRRRDAARELSRALLLAPYTPAPDALRVRIIEASSRAGYRRGSAAPWNLAAAAVLLLAIGASAGALVTSRSRTDPLAEEVVASHIRSLIVPNHLTDVLSSDRHTVKPWFAGKLTFAPPVEDLSSVGFPLVGGRVDYVSGRPVAAVVYARRDHRINLFMWPADRDRAAEQSTSRGFHLLRWTAHGMSFWLVSDVSADDLRELMRALS